HRPGPGAAQGAEARGQHRHVQQLRLWRHQRRADPFQSMRLWLIPVVLAVMVAGVVEWVNAAWDAPGLPAASGNETVVLIPPHMRTHDIARILDQKGILRHALVFEMDARVRSLSG